ncbi:MAG: TIGR01212 family radical SAM protein [Deltaproteobacteria bacterium]|nr:TIGR01212 family radical SAM protein [Deltaproteobacteria bacterium]
MIRESPILPPLHPELRYHNYASYLRRRLGGTAVRIPVDGGFTCPNRDGTIGVGGCSWCNNDAFTPGIRFPGLPVEEQVRRSIQSPGRHHAFRRFLVYFQKFSNSYASPEELRRKYRAAFAHPDVAGIVVGTRPDCLGGGVLDVLSEVARDRYVCVEVGLQSMSDAVLRRMNRGHGVERFVEAASAVRDRGIDVGVHLIYGLPGDTRTRFLSAAPFLSRLGVHAVKLHHFHVVRGSSLEAAFHAGKVRTPAYDDYLSACADFLERLSPEVAVMRLMGEAPRHLLLGPRWEKGPRELASDLSATLASRGTRQGARWNGGRGRRARAGR